MSDTDTSDDPSVDPKVVFVDAHARAHPRTSCEAFRIEEDSGRAQRKRDVVAWAFKQFGPGTSAEVLLGAGLDENLNLWRARVAELTNEGVLKKIGERPCRVTNHEAAVLQYVLPQDRVRRVRVDPRDASIIELCDALESIAEDPAATEVLGRPREELREMIVRGRALARKK